MPMDRSVATGGKESPGAFTTDGRSSDDELAHLHDALEKARRGKQAGTRRRAVVLAALCLLLLAAGSGLGLAVFGFLRPPQDQSAVLVRNLILAASAMSLVYIGFHVRGARSNRIRPPGPPHFYGEYTLAGALMVSRLAIGVWAAAVVAAVIAVASGPNPFSLGLAGATSPSLSLGVLLPLLQLVVCLVALPSFLTIAATIESQQAPFATAGLSPARPPLRTYRSDDSADGMDEHISISRRMSMERAAASQESTESLEKPPAVHIRRARSRSPLEPGLQPLQLGTADWRGDDDAKTELMANSPVRPAYRARPRTSRTLPPPYSVPPVPPLPPLSKIRSMPHLRNSPWPGPRPPGSSHSATAPATGAITSRRAGSSRGSSPDTTPPSSSRGTRGRVPVIPGTTAVRAAPATGTITSRRAGYSRGSSPDTTPPSSSRGTHGRVPAIPGTTTVRAAPATGAIISRHAGSSRGSSPDTTPPSRGTRERVPVISGTTAVRATQLPQPSATRHGKRPSRSRGLSSSSLMEPRGNGH